ncbi:tetratricopeptide repeat protein [Parafilimonas sp.]|uniref:tetratricopeptide repeat protein n=1 Tax=Parafilimonas sp. TaxID=1969739 RepID=UPI0039E554C9
MKNMLETLEYIESFFQRALNAGEKQAFEKRCETDDAFAKEVAFYIATREALREDLLAKKQQEWKALTTDEENTSVIAMYKKSSLSRWLMYAAAACVLLTVSMFLFEMQSSPKRLASQYINNIDLSQTMDASHDSLQLGIAAYKNRDYSKALGYFEGVVKQDTANSDAKKYAGLAYMQLNDYDKALEAFDALANMKGLYYNPGDFLKAVALLKRNKAGDEATAKTLLQQVVNENESEKETAEEWLKKF